MVISAPKRLVLDFAEDDPVEETEEAAWGLSRSLRALAKADCLVALDMNLNAAGFTNAHVAGISSEIPPNLKELRVNCAGLSALGAGGATSICMNLPEGLTELRLLFPGCHLEAHGARQVVRFVPERCPLLEVLELDMEYCLVGETGAISLSQMLRRLPKLWDLNLRLSCNVLGERGAEALAESLPDSLRRLVLLLQRCGLGQRAKEAFERRRANLPLLPPHEVKLRYGAPHPDLGPPETPEVDPAVAALEEKVAPWLEDLREAFRQCDVNGDGNISRKELLVALEKYGNIQQLFDGAEKGRAFRQMAGDDAEVSWPEFLSFLANECLPSANEKAERPLPQEPPLTQLASTKAPDQKSPKSPRSPRKVMAMLPMQQRTAAIPEERGVPFGASVSRTSAPRSTVA